LDNLKGKMYFSLGSTNVIVETLLPVLEAGVVKDDIIKQQHYLGLYRLFFQRFAGRIVDKHNQLLNLLLKVFSSPSPNVRLLALEVLLTFFYLLFIYSSVYF
jgi:hypothetical protein